MPTTPDRFAHLSPERLDALRDALRRICDAERLPPGNATSAETRLEATNALSRMEEGDYGVCQNCAELIPYERLVAVPWARYCAPCQSEIEIIEQSQPPQARFGELLPND